MIPNKYEPSVIFSEKEIDILRRNTPIELFEKTFTLPNGYPIYPNIVISETGIGYERYVSADTNVIKEQEGVLYLWRVSQTMYFILKSNNPYTDAFCNDYTDKSLKEFEGMKIAIRKECLSSAELVITQGFIDENNPVCDYACSPLIERLDKYIKS